MKDHSLEVDPIELDPELADIFESAEREAQAELERREGDNLPMLLGQWFERDLIKQKILKEKYGIEWKTTCEMNPMMTFD